MNIHCVVGRHLKLRENGLHTVEDLLPEMDYYGIAEVLVVDSLSVENHPWYGFLRILGVTKNSPRLLRTCSALLSGVKDGPLPLDELMKEMRRQQMDALFLYPNPYAFNLFEWNIDELMAPLAAEDIPIFINPAVSKVSGADATNWSEVIALRQRWSLPVVISKNRIHRSQRQLYKAFDACPNQEKSLILGGNLKKILEKYSLSG